MVIILHLQEWVAVKPKRPERLRRLLSRLVGYHLYREYHVDSGVYHLTNNEMALYCRLQYPLKEILIEASRLAFRRVRIVVDYDDAYVIPIKELPDVR